MRTFVAAALLVSSAVLAESSSVNIHLEPSADLLLNDPNGVVTGSGVAFKVDTKAFGLGMFAPQGGLFTVGVPSRSVLNSGTSLGATVGVRARLLDDHSGYLIHLGSEAGHQGNLFGNLFVDASVSWAGTSVGFGFEAGGGVELSLIDGIQLGPIVRFIQTGPASLVEIGVSLSIGFPDADTKHAEAPAKPAETTPSAPVTPTTPAPTPATPAPAQPPAPTTTTTPAPPATPPK